MNNDVLEVGETVIFEHEGKTLCGEIVQRLMMGPTVTDFLYKVKVEGWIGTFEKNRKQLNSVLDDAYDRAMRIL